MSEASADYWVFWSDDARRTGSELYARLSACAGHDDGLRAIAAHAQKGQPQANMLLAAVHFLLLRGTDHPVKEFYPSVGGQRDAADEDLSSLFRDFVERNRIEVTRLIESRVTNTNEVGRSALLHAGFRELAKSSPEPLALIEIGPSAGLNLLWDRYGVRYMRAGRIAAVVGSDSRLVLDCELRGAATPPAGPMPLVARRLGLEANPVDLTDQDDRDWLRALVWPTDLARLERLTSAVALFEQDRPEIRAGDALALLPDALAQAPREATLCVYHTIVLYQFSREMREVLENILVVAGLRRPVFRLAMEFDGADYALSLIGYDDGTREQRCLAIWRA